MTWQRELYLRVLISIPWAMNMSSSSISPKMRRLIERTIREGVAKNKGHEAIFGYYVGNEIPYAMVRWLGARRVIEFVEKLIRIAREADPRPLYSYASYPPTEYLRRATWISLSDNAYLDASVDFESYSSRVCKTLAEDRPLIFGEFGLDTASASPRRSKRRCSRGISRAPGKAEQVAPFSLLDRRVAYWRQRDH